ncbi:hypothetical protein [Clostridium estertheticum]|uniref:hypothetical protein n=1 Tax=Clostridium estertheticum TaxID=238834 RepID=UPI001C7E15A1|nr:hypothetical protein [Clostridium estertheticum]MBX4268902.1 hypothetical protein [Clostridium estertheticum]WLC78905.1 hypothetical protein KTC98_17170 [Clostridium estertheticum]
MNKLEEELDRFTLRKENINVVFVPQCCRFKGYYVCDKFSDKPLEYRKNEEVCRFI